MRRIFICTLLMAEMAVGILSAQSQLSSKSAKAVQLYQAALVFANKNELPQSIKLLHEALSNDSTFIEAWLVLGDLYTDMKRDTLSIESYKKAIKINPDYFPPAYSNLANREFENGMYSDALEHVNKYLTYTISVKLKNKALMLKKNCEFAVNAVKNPVPFNPQSLGANINSKFDQYSPSLSADGQTLVFTTLVPKDSANLKVFGNRQEDFYYSTFENGQWTPARSMGAPLNTPDNEGASTISGDGKFLIFTGCNRVDGYGSCDLYFSKKEGEKWSEPQNMGKPINSNYKETQPSLSPDGKTLYFASNRPGGKGGLDIWKSTRDESGAWQIPVNLGDSINTTLDEEAPFIHSDNQTLYFASKGWPGLGGFDLFISKRKGDNDWTTPVNLGYPINTRFDEETVIVNAKGETAYYSTGRYSANGSDIYSFDMPKAVRPTMASYMKGRVFDASSENPLTARFELIDLGTSKTVMDALSNTDGTFLVCIPTGKDYALNVSKKGYLFYSDNFTMKQGDYTSPFLKDVPMKPIKAGEKVVMRNVFFDTDSYQLKPESKIELNRLVALLKDNPTMKIELSGHTDNTGKPDHNLRLSDNRARAVVDYLVQNGIEMVRLTAKGYGETKPLLPNISEENRTRNRRTEFMVVEK
ncbi:MAG: OmpA family protein [Bacteroidota bacterium]|nr:OmpA family protein [Bacteroidota bacterium]